MFIGTRRQTVIDCNRYLVFKAVAMFWQLIRLLSGMKVHLLPFAIYLSNRKSWYVMTNRLLQKCAECNSDNKVKMNLSIMKQFQATLQGNPSPLRVGFYDRRGIISRGR